MCSLAALARGCRPAAKPCCLCWCCCCSCSCLAARASDGEPGKKPRGAGPADPLLCDTDAPPSLEEIRSWGQSFDRLMRNAAGRKVFRDFLRGEYSEENIMFWLACEELKRETDPDAVEEKARFIYEDYISILSPKEVSLDSRVREVVNRNMVEPTPHTFDEAQLQIYTLMHRDSYPRFVNSPLYKTLARLSNGEPASAPTTADKGDKVSDRAGDRGSEKGGDRVSEKGDRGGEKAGDRVSEKDGDKVSEKGGDRVSEKGGDRVSEKGGDKVSDRASEKSGDKNSEKSGDKVSEKAGDKGDDKSAADAK